MLDLDSPPEMQIVIPSRAKATAFYDLVAYVFLKVCQVRLFRLLIMTTRVTILMLLLPPLLLQAKKKSATLPSPSSSALCHLRLSINYQEMYKEALTYLQEPGPVKAKKDVL